jgi:hypothetical protein
MNVQNWARFLEVENELWSRVQALKGITRDHVLDFSRYVQEPTQGNPGYVQEQTQKPPEANKNLTGMPRFQAIATIAYVLNQKLKLRDVNQRYDLTYKRNGVNADPYPTQFQWKNVTHRMSSNYDGNSVQVGNYKVETLSQGQWIAIIFDKADALNTAEMDFLLMCEIARRKTRDPQKLNGDDAFRYTLPIAICVASGIELASSNKITVQSLLGTSRENNVFKDYPAMVVTRIDRAKKLLDTALEHYSFVQICMAVSDYYEFDAVVADVNMLFS